MEEIRFDTNIQEMAEQSEEKEIPTSLLRWEAKKSKRKAIAELRKEYELKRFRNLSLQFK